MLELSIPEQRTNPGVSLETGLAPTERWLARLPMLDLPQAARKIHDALFVLNRTPLKDDARLKLLELYRGPIMIIGHEMQLPQVGFALPLAGKSKQVAELARLLGSELAIGYKAVVMARLHRLKPAQQREQIILPVYRALEQLAHTLLKSYAYYAPYPAGAWREIHALYRYAESLGILDKNVEEPPLPAAVDHIEHLYKKALLLGLADPYHLPFGVIEQVYTQMDRWVALVRLLPHMDGTNQKCQFQIDLDTDRAGALQSGADGDNHARHVFLDTRDLVRSLHAQLLTLQNHDAEGAAADERNEDVLRHLVTAWGLGPTRRFARIHRDGQCEIAVGLDSVNFVINGEKYFECTSVDEDDTGQTVLGTYGHQKLQRRRGAVTKHAWIVMDESASGLGLNAQAPENVQARVGDVIATRLTAPHADWAVGVIRWLKSAGSEHMVVGVQRLAPAARAAAVKPVQINTDGVDELVLAVLLPEMPALKTPESLLTPRGIFAAERNLFMDTGDGLHMIRAKRLIESTRAFERFEFAVLNI